MHPSYGEEGQYLFPTVIASPLPARQVHLRQVLLLQRYFLKLPNFFASLYASIAHHLIRVPLYHPEGIPHPQIEVVGEGLVLRCLLWPCTSWQVFTVIAGGGTPSGARYQASILSIPCCARAIGLCSIVSVCCIYTKGNEWSLCPRLSVCAVNCMPQAAFALYGGVMGCLKALTG